MGIKCYFYHHSEKIKVSFVFFMKKIGLLSVLRKYSENLAILIFFWSYIVMFKSFILVHNYLFFVVISQLKSCRFLRFFAFEKRHCKNDPFIFLSKNKNIFLMISMYTSIIYITLMLYFFKWLCYTLFCVKISLFISSKKSNFFLKKGETRVDHQEDNYIVVSDE